MEIPETPSTNPKDRIGVTKVPLDLVPLSSQVVQALAHLDGACKYGPYNWRDESVAATVYVAACKRHVDKWLNGRDTDADSGVHELGHAIACLNIIVDAQVSGNLIDNRPKANPSPEMLDAAAGDVKAILRKYGKLKEAALTPQQKRKDNMTP